MGIRAPESLREQFLAGNYRYNLAWGHGGQQIVLLDDLDMMIVLLADPLHLQHGDGPWRIEKSNLNLVADFVASLPGELIIDGEDKYRVVGKLYDLLSHAAHKKQVQATAPLRG
jgi:hypothetical protein